jgi:uncharacterized membrane protein
MEKLNCILIISLFLFSCSKSEEPVSNTCASTVTYTSGVGAIISKSCAIAGCHVTGGAGNGVLTTLAGVKTKVDNGSFKTRVLDKKDMPPAGSTQLSTAELELLQCWLTNGAK